MAKSEGLSEEDRQYLEVAAAFHDSGFLVSGTDHELEGCRIVEQILPEFDFTPEEIERICAMIMATLVPQNPMNHLEQVLCDADLDYLGRDDFPPISQLLFEEFLYRGVVGDEDAWMALQISFLKKHKYWTSSTKANRDALKAEHLEKIIQDWNEPQVK
jgi:uncharacterized protein